MIEVPQIKVEEDYEVPKMQQVIGQGPFRITSLSETKRQILHKSSEWTIVENAKYAGFIRRNAQKMEGKAHGKLWMLHQEMAKVVKSRNFRQCKLHHQRMVSDFGSIAGIVSYLTGKYPQFQGLLVSEMREEQRIVQKQSENRIKTVGGSSFGDDKLEKQDEIPTDIKYRDEEGCVEWRNSGDKLSHFPSVMPRMGQMNAGKTQKWEQCHKYFLEWTSRLNYLMAPRSAQ